ncbi:MAG: hypothetical protein JWQ88_612, partial [Rhodoferax sp.]|nr:hypothetical protein [Rhodoferax sp.]
MQPDPSPYRPVFSSSVARRLGPYALIACGLALLVGSSLAQPVSLAEVQRIKAEVDVPRWREAAALSRLLRANPPDAATAEQWRLLDAETDPSTGKTPLDQIDHAAVAWRNANARWLRWRVLSQNADARYSFAYA